MSDSRPSGSSGGSGQPDPVQKNKKSYGRLHIHVSVFKASWMQMAQSLWRRYPNPFSTHVLSEDTVFREQQSATRLSSKRLIKKTNRAPRWMEAFIGGDRSAAIMEESVVDLTSRTFTTYTRNITFSSLMSVEEKCVYYESPENRDWTCCKKEAWIKCSVRGVGRPVEKYGVERYKKNSKKAEQGLEYVLGTLFSVPIVITTPSKATPIRLSSSVVAK